MAKKKNKSEGVAGEAAEKEQAGGTEAGGSSPGGFYGRLPELRLKAQALAAKGLDEETIATLLEEPVERVRQFMEAAVKKGRAQLRVQIMRAQIDSAVVDRDPVMLKRLGEEFCGQGIITQQGAIANAGKQVFVLNVGTPPKNLDGPPPPPVRALPSPKKVEVIEAEFEDVTEE